MSNPYEITASILSDTVSEAESIHAENDTSFHGIELYGKTVVTYKTTPDCRIYHFENETGTGEISCYPVFAGIELFYNDMHTAYCNQKQATEKNIIEINHCCKGRYECSFGDSGCCYMAEGDLAVGALSRKKTYSSFPLSHYHGITIVINLEKLLPEVRAIMTLLSIKIEKIQKMICEENRCGIMRANPSIEHIFSELYYVREEHKAGYMKVKILELLLFLSDLDTNDELVQTEKYNQNRVHIIKEIAAFITENSTKHYTIEQLSEKFHISATALKKCFRGVYGSSVYAYLRTYRLQVAERLLMETTKQVTEIAAQIGYENPNKFTSAFKSFYGVTPTELRKSAQKDRKWTVWSGKEL